MVWIGAKKDSSFTSRTWRWLTGEKVNKPPWGREQPNNYNGEQNCAVLDGGRDWRWNDVGCNLDYFHWICMFCKHPHLILLSIQSFVFTVDIMLMIE